MGNTLAVGGGTGQPVVSLATAREYLNDDEFNRIHAAFSRFKKTHLSFDDFCLHVLGGGKIPEEQQRLLFNFCTRGADFLSFENLLCSLVGLCRIQDVQAAFIEENREFATWGLSPPRLTLPMKDDYISFYEVMSYVTHLAVEEVMELEKVFATISDRHVCKMSTDSWDACLAGCYPASFSRRLFCVLDENNDGFIDFRELVCGVSGLCRAPYPSRLSFLAKLWDFDGDGQLSDEELEAMYNDLNVSPADRTISKSVGEKAAVVDVATWAVGNDYLKDYIVMAEEIGHICLGLRPLDRSVEFSTVSTFLSRTDGLPIAERSIVSSYWFKQWDQTTSAGKTAPPIDNSLIKGAKEDEGWSGKVACISIESSSLKTGLARNEYIAVPPPLWRAWLRWHGSPLALDCQFTRKYLGGEFFEDGNAGLELYPLDILLVGHDKKRKDQDGVQQLSPWACAQVSRSTTLDSLLELCKSELRLKDNECRLWLAAKENGAEDNFTLLDEEHISLYDLKLSNKKVNKFLLEVRDPSTGIWPEELRASVTGTQIKSIGNTVSTRPGAVGLVNAGNFCYRNAAVQCLARVSPLTEFLLKDENICLLSKDIVNNNRSVITALEYANLLKEMWTGKKKNISPIDFNNAVRSASDLFECGEQHDCQEFVSFLIESLHSCMHEEAAEAQKTSLPENGVKEEAQKPEVEKKDEKEKKEEEIVDDDKKADEAWETYAKREHSLVTSLFSGQLRSRLICRACQSASTVFEPFSSLSLPIGFDNTEPFQVIVIRLDGTIPHRYGFLVSREATIAQFKGLISDAAGLSPEKMTLQCFRRRRSIPNTGNTEVFDSLRLRQFAPGTSFYAMELPEDGSEWRLTAHRKLQCNLEPYLLGATGGCIPSRFGLPLILSRPEGATGRLLYDDVMNQMRRFMVAPPPSFSNRAMDPCEDSSSGYPFSLSVVDKNWEWCGQCEALRFCRGCTIRPDDSLAYIPEDCSIAVDWLPTALYLKYNHSQELKCIEDPSVSETMNRYAAPSSLEECLAKFSCPENLEEPLHCDKCKRKTNRSKVMSVWRLPRYVIVHLKRFEYLVNEQHVGKCKRTIDFPLNNFDPSAFVNRHDGGRYDCIAIANHYGELSSGHFVAYARGKDEKWLLLNDCSVREVAEDEVDKTAAYLLFYERQNA